MSDRPTLPGDADELEHRDPGLDHGAELAPGYRLMSRVIKAGCKVAIAVSERIQVRA